MTRRRQRRIGKWPIAISSLLITGFLYKAVISPSVTQSPQGSNGFSLTHSQLSALKPQFHDGETSSGSERRLRVFMPADAANLNLCKTIMSSVALGYPLPTLLNWDGDFNRPEWHFAGSHIAKLESLLAVIEELLHNEDDANEDDLALMVDAYDLWFQLPPSVLIQRFHQLNHEADERNRLEWEKAGPDFPIPPPRQNIIVTTAKDCFPTADSGSDPHYELWPPSPMPEDLYAENTDTLTPPLWDSARKYRKVRPRCVNSGMIMGTMGVLRDALRRCKEKVENVARAGRQIWSDQALIGEVIGDQEAWRTWVRELADTWNGTLAESQSALLDGHVRNIAAAAMDGEHFEFGIGLDYNFTTIPATCSAEEDGYFVKINDSATLIQQSERAGVPDVVRVQGIPPELQTSSIDDDPFADVQWGDEPLYTDFYFGTTPVGIHHNAYIEGLKPWRIKNWWSRMWFYPKLRDLVTQSLRASEKTARPLLKVAREGADDVVYRAPKGSKVTVFTPGKGGRETVPATFKPIDWDGVCQKGSKPWHEGLFGDGKGPLLV